MMEVLQYIVYHLFLILQLAWLVISDCHEALITIFFLAMSLIAFFCYGRDKKLAKQHKWRIPEKLLLGLGFFGGAIGALAGMQLFRHKTKHWYFWVINVIGLLWQAACLCYVYSTALLQFIEF